MLAPESPEELSRSDVLPERADRRLGDDARALRLELEKRTRQLERSEARFRDVIERNPDAQIVVDRDGMIRFANAAAARLFGRTYDELAGSQFGFPLVVGETTEVDLFVRETPRIAEMRVVLSEWEGSTAFIASLRDITERKRAEQDARRLIREQAARAAAEDLATENARLYEEAHLANQRKADFLAVVSHDLRTPLTAILGYADLLDMGVPDPLTDGCRDRVGRIRTSAKHLLYLLNELLAFARLESSREQPEIQEVDLKALTNDIAAVMEPLAAERHLEFRVELPRQPMTIRTDPDKLRQIVLNLVGNAIKYTRRGEVCLALRAAENDRVELEVADTGDGIAEQHLSRIFDPFWQVDATQRSHGGGTGLGLSVVQHLVGLLGGDVTVRSTVGSGSVFTVTLPTGLPATEVAAAS
jgi:signal transduction histidine kinase